MKIDVTLLFVAASMMILFVGATYFGSLQESSAMAEELGPLIGIDSNSLIPHLKKILQRFSLRRAIIVSVPWMALFICILIRIIKQRGGGVGSGADGPAER